ncbi:MAG: hypothetical protein ACYC6A_11895 [Armatimonadota bacterium]
MRKWGWILGGLFVADGVIALVSGRRILNWAEKKARKLPRGRLAKLMKQGRQIQPGMLKAWGINNVLAGLGMLAITLLAQRHAART